MRVCNSLAAPGSDIFMMPRPFKVDYAVVLRCYSALSDTCKALVTSFNATTTRTSTTDATLPLARATTSFTLCQQDMT